MPASQTSRPSWDIAALSRPPRVWETDQCPEPGVRSIFFQGPAYRGRETRAFAYLGIPEVPLGKSVPGMVLLHGGGGTAFAQWVRLWNQKGYAAIAFDQCGCLPTPIDGPAPDRLRHEHSGPMGWANSFTTMDEPIEDHWPHQAVSLALLAHSTLAAQPGVDADRIGVTGTSWGGYLTCLVAGVDPRNKFAAPVYGCGFLGDNSCWKIDAAPKLPAGAWQRWIDTWDPSQFLGHAKLPMLWVSGSTDFAYPLDSLQKSYRLAPGERTLCIRPNMGHSHPAGWEIPDITVFAEHLFNQGDPPPRIVAQGRDGRTLWVRYESVRPLRSPELCFTRATGCWSDRKFNALAAQHDAGARRVEAPCPPLASVAYLNLSDDRGCVVSSEHVEFELGA